MATKYLALLTNIGAAKLAKATALGTKVEITQLAVGDGNGVLPTPNPAQTALVHELRRAPLNMLTVDPANASQIIAEQVIPEDVGGWWIREIGLFDKDGDMVAIANCAETYKPQLQEGSGRVQVIRVILIVSSTEAVTLKIDPAVVLATRQYVDSQLRAHEQSRNHPDASTTEKGFVQLSSSVTSDSESQAATSKAVKIAMDNANARLAKERNLADLPNPALARQNLQLGNSSTKNIGTTADTVAAGDDARITGAMQKNKNGGDIPDVAKFLQNLGLSDALHKGDGRLLSGTYVSDAEDKKSIGLRASTGCQFMRAYQAPDAPSQTAYWDVVVMPESTVAGNPVSCIAISVGDIYVGHGTIAGITTWVRLSSDNAAPPIGIPFYWPLAALPDSVVPEWAGMTFLKMNGATFSATQYPKLAKVWPTLSLSETRGEFIRVADDGRGVNPGRAALSYEDDMFKSHSHFLYRSDNLLQTGSSASDVGSQYQSAGLTGYVTADSGGSETRPRNIAFYFIVRAK